jgi:hypothetical protein
VKKGAKLAEKNVAMRCDGWIIAAGALRAFGRACGGLRRGRG